MNTDEKYLWALLEVIELYEEAEDKDRFIADYKKAVLAALDGEDYLD